MARSCKVSGCGRKYVAKGFCDKHYRQIRNHGKILERTMYDKNEIIIGKDEAYIILYNRNSEPIEKAIIDIESVPIIKKYKWFLNKNKNGYKSVATTKWVNLATIILGPKKGFIIDHKDRNALNNKKENLRHCTRHQNLFNAFYKNKSGFKGVVEHGYKWRAWINLNKKRINLGTFKTKEQAAEMYNEAAKWFHGEFAYLNPVGVDK